MSYWRKALNRWNRRLLAGSSGQMCPLDALRLGLVSFSQAGEDLVLYNLLIALKRRPPFHYIDVGCFEPVRYSNTYFFYLLGGSGLVIDLHENHRLAFSESRPRDTFVASVVTENNEDVTVISDGTPFDGICRDESEGVRLMKSATLANILREHWPANQQIDILDVDCEGSDLSVLRSNDWNTFRPALICVEDVDPHGQSGSEKLLGVHGYRLSLKLRANSFFVDTQAEINSP